MSNEIFLAEFALKQRQMYYDPFYREFYQIFHVPLKRFWDNITGFDVLKFDEKVLKPQGDESSLDAANGSSGITRLPC